LFSSAIFSRHARCSGNTLNEIASHIRFFRFIRMGLIFE
jgi:hypothetical protein